MPETDKLIIKRLIILGLLFLSALLAWWPDFGMGFGQLAETSSCPESKLCVAFLNVGQGDAIFVQSPTGEQLLIDGGRSSGVLRELSGVMGFFDKDIDYILVTHPDADHVGGLVDVFDRYQISRVIRTENESNTPVWQAVESRIQSEGIEVTYARRGQRYDLGGGVVLEILFPDIDVESLESNTSSIVARLTYGEISFLFTGDSPKSIEEYLVLIEGEYLQSDVLKVGHHGSRTSTSELFLSEVAPTYAVISAGKDNQYGHPHVEVTDMLLNYGVETMSTAEQGTIVFVSDRVGLMVK